MKFKYIKHNETQNNFYQKNCKSVSLDIYQIECSPVSLTLIFMSTYIDIVEKKRKRKTY